MRKPRIPMQPELLPQQQVVPVISLPKQPIHFAIHMDRHAALQSPDRPREMPPSAMYLCLLEWATSPWECRQAAYYLSTNRSRRHWLLWLWDWDDNWGQWTQSLCAYGPRRGVATKTAAMHLLRAAWAHDKSEIGQGHFDWIAEDFYLEVPEILAIARAVWP